MVDVLLLAVDRDRLTGLLAGVGTSSTITRLEVVERTELGQRCVTVDEGPLCGRRGRDPRTEYTGTGSPSRPSVGGRDRRLLLRDQRRRVGEDVGVALERGGDGHGEREHDHHAATQTSST
jgi:hypothetical protein